MSLSPPSTRITRAQPATIPTTPAPPTHAAQRHRVDGASPVGNQSGTNTPRPGKTKPKRAIAPSVSPNSLFAPPSKADISPMPKATASNTQETRFSGTRRTNSDPTLRSVSPPNAKTSASPVVSAPEKP